MIAYLEVVHAKATCPEVDSARVACNEDDCRGVIYEVANPEGQKFVNLPCNTTNTVLQVLAMDMTPECNRVEKKSSEEMIMSVNQRVDVKIKYEHKANMKSQVVV